MEAVEQRRNSGQSATSKATRIGLAASLIAPAASMLFRVLFAAIKLDQALRADLTDRLAGGELDNDLRPSPDATATKTLAHSAAAMPPASGSAGHDRVVLP